MALHKGRGICVHTQTPPPTHWMARVSYSALIPYLSNSGNPNAASQGCCEDEARHCTRSSQPSTRHTDTPRMGTAVAWRTRWLRLCKCSGKEASAWKQTDPSPRVSLPRLLQPPEHDSLTLHLPTGYGETGLSLAEDGDKPRWDERLAAAMATGTGQTSIREEE